MHVPLYTTEASVSKYTITCFSRVVAEDMNRHFFVGKRGHLRVLLDCPSVSYIFFIETVP